MAIDLGNILKVFPKGDTITDKKFVHLDSNGAIWSRPRFDTVYPLVTSASGANIFLYTSPEHIIKPLDKSRIVIAYMTYVNPTYYINVRVGSVNNVGQITWGTMVQTYSTTATTLWPLYELIVLNSNTIVVRTRSTTGSAYSYCQAVTISGTTITGYGSLTDVNISSIGTVGVALTSSYIMLASGTGTNITACLISVSGTTISTAVAPVIIESGKTSLYNNSISRIDNNRALFTYNTTSGTTTFKAIVLKTPSYTTITQGAIAQVDITGAGSEVNCCVFGVNGNLGNVAVFYGNPICQRVLDINDTTLNGYSIVNFTADVCYKMQSVSSNNNTILLSTNKTLYTFQWQGTNLVLLDTITAPTGFDDQDGTCIFSLDNGRFLFVDGTGIAKVIQRSKIIGISRGTTGAVIMKGIVQGLSGITISSLNYTDGFQFYPNNNTGIYTKVGIGLSATDLVMDDFIPANNINNL